MREDAIKILHAIAMIRIFPLPHPTGPGFRARLPGRHEPPAVSESRFSSAVHSHRAPARALARGASSRE
jgi:hypothetical protein